MRYSHWKLACPCFYLAVFFFLAALTTGLTADERRAPPPKFSNGSLRGIFFDDLSDAFPGKTPTLSQLRAAVTASIKAAETQPKEAAEASNGLWSALISPTTIEDEVKRIRLHFDSVVTKPGDFAGGGYLEARLDLTVLAALFAVIHEHGGDVRWKSDAAAARDLIARTAFNCKAGSTQVYNEAKLRKADLQDLVSGGGITAREASDGEDWSTIANRSPLMEYIEQLIEELEDASRNEASIKADSDLVKRNSELLAMIGAVLVQEGMEQADDDDYAAHSRSMTEEAKGVTAALERMDVDAIRKGAAAIRQRCDACHEEYR